MGNENLFLKFAKTEDEEKSCSFGSMLDSRGADGVVLAWHNPVFKPLQKVCNLCPGLYKLFERQDLHCPMNDHNVPLEGEIKYNWIHPDEVQTP